MLDLFNELVGNLGRVDTADLAECEPPRGDVGRIEQVEPVVNLLGREGQLVEQHHRWGRHPELRIGGTPKQLRPLVLARRIDELGEILDRRRPHLGR